MRQRRYPASSNHALNAFVHRNFPALHVAFCGLVQVILERLVDSGHVALLHQHSREMRAAGHAAALGLHFFERDIHSQ